MIINGHPRLGKIKMQFHTPSSYNIHLYYGQFRKSVIGYGFFAVKRGYGG
jgi:hypothetical protein